MINFDKPVHFKLTMSSLDEVLYTKPKLKVTTQGTGLKHKELYFDNVPDSEMLKMINAGSPASYFNLFILPNYKHNVVVVDDRNNKRTRMRATR